ncbi:hypothetical protein OH492_10015 [Vibrio chagasii]|nr:hypothetical protein [Vibrio chagasii]
MKKTERLSTSSFVVRNLQSVLPTLPKSKKCYYYVALQDNIFRILEMSGNQEAKDALFRPKRST